tara:strand:+ start:392 stop:577 length:186 start_codon:yes stop_codon:yes gene_type:complete
MKVGDLVRLSPNCSLIRKHGSTVGLVVGKHWNNLGTFMEVIFQGEVESVHAAWLRKVRESR